MPDTVKGPLGATQVNYLPVSPTQFNAKPRNLGIATQVMYLVVENPGCVYHFGQLSSISKGPVRSLHLTPYHKPSQPGTPTPFNTINTPPSTHRRTPIKNPLPQHYPNSTLISSLKNFLCYPSGHPMVPVDSGETSTSRGRGGESEVNEPNDRLPAVL
jgi:hypothetical protein